MTINVYLSSCNVSVIIVRFLMKLEFSRQIFDKYSNIKFHDSQRKQNGSMRTDRQDKANSHSL